MKFSMESASRTREEIVTMLKFLCNFIVDALKAMPTRPSTTHYFHSIIVSRAKLICCRVFDYKRIIDDFLTSTKKKEYTKFPLS